MLLAAAFVLGCSGAETGGQGGSPAAPPIRVRVAQYNIYFLSTAKLLDASDDQVTAAADVVARFDPDLLAINEIEFDRSDVAPADFVPGRFNAGAHNAERLAERLNAVTPGEPYTHTLITVGNSGFVWDGPDNGVTEFGARGLGTLGQLNYALLSRHPILEEGVRVITDLPWDALPESTLAHMQAEVGITAPAGYPLYSKALVIAPVQVADRVLYMLLLHTVPPVWDMTRPYRNYDELRGVRLLLDGSLPGVEPLPTDAKFVLLGDFNVDPDDGEALPGAIAQLLDHPRIVPFQPEGGGTAGNHPERNTQASACPSATSIDPTTDRQLQLDYLLPAATMGEPLDGGVFFPDPLGAPGDFDLACRASDHMLLWADLNL